MKPLIMEHSKDLLYCQEITMMYQAQIVHLERQLIFMMVHNSQQTWQFKMQLVIHLEGQHG